MQEIQNLWMQASTDFLIKCIARMKPFQLGIILWKSRKWKWNGKWKMELETGNRNGNTTSYLHCPSKIHMLLALRSYASQSSPCFHFLITCFLHHPPVFSYLHAIRQILGTRLLHVSGHFIYFFDQTSSCDQSKVRFQFLKF